MSNPDSYSNRVRDSEQGRRVLDNLNKSARRNWQTLTIGAVLGLLLGLFIGWYLWPVQYTTAWPSELDSDAKAQYIAAVADAYVAVRSEQAAQLAKQRLAWFGAETGDEVAAAQQHYAQSDSTDNSLRVTNIEELALVLNLPPEVAGVPAEVAEQEPTPADDLSPPRTSSPEDQVTTTSPGVPEWLRLGLWMLAAFVLIAGGIWVLRTVMRHPSTESDTWDEDGIEEFEDHGYVQPDEPDRIDEIVAPSSARVEDPDESGHEVDTIVFESSDVDETPLDESHQPDDPPSTEKQHNVSVTSGSAGAVMSSVAVTDPDGYGFEPESEVGQPLGSTRTIIIEEVEADEIPIADDESARDADPNDRPTSATEGAEDSSASTDAIRQVSVAAGPEVARFTAHFLPSLDEYEEAFTIEEQGGYIGDCGMGVNMKYGLVLHNPEHVSVLDVWLVDLAQEAEMTFHSMLLVSKHGVENEIPQTLAEENEQKQMVLAPKTGESFQIVGRELLIDCVAVAVRYAEQGQVEGVFTECRIEMVVSRRS